MTPPQHQRGVNHLYPLRRNRGLLQKHLAVLIGHRGTQMVSQYERGRSLPTLQIALLLHIILGAQLDDIYVELCRDLRCAVLKRAKKLPERVRRDLYSRLLRKD